MISNYSQLLSAISLNIKRDDIADQYSTFVQFCEARLNRILRTSEMETRSQGIMDAGDEYIALPTDFLALRDIQINRSGKTQSLEYRSPAELNVINSREHGIPQFFTVIDFQIQIGPIPIEETTVEIVYYAKIPALETSTTNWLLTKSPDIYLFGALIEAESYLINDKRIPLWKSRMDEAIRELRDADAGLKWGASPLQQRVG